MNLTGLLLGSIDPAATLGAALNSYASELDLAMTKAGLKTVPRAAAFLAQLAWESAHFGSLVEATDGRAYEGRADLGNTQPGDGLRFRGRGFIQITGRSNYRAAGAAIGLDLITTPESAEDPSVAAAVATWYWDSRKLSVAADRYDLTAITRAVNGAATMNAPSWHSKRVALYARALEALGKLT